MFQTLTIICNADPQGLAPWLDQPRKHLPAILFWIIAGASTFGAAIGLWRAPLQATYVAIKFPLLIGLTTLGNLMLNGMLAQLLGSTMSFRQSTMAILISGALLAVILGSLAPISIFLLMNFPTASDASAATGHRWLLFINTVIIAFAGIAANLRLYGLLKHLHSRALARRIILSWLATNLFLGAQLSWNMRPFFGSPSLVVRFLRENPFDGTFYEAVYHIIKALLSN